MKSITLKSTIILLALLITGTAFSQGVVISDDENATPHGSAMLEVQSSDKGFLPPRITTSERNSIAGPATGLVVFDTEVNSLFLFDGTGWVPLVAGTGSRWEAEGDDIFYNEGNVGIGTSTPGSGANTKFDVLGRVSFRTDTDNPDKLLIHDHIGGRKRIYTDALSGTPGDLIIGTYPNGHSNQLFLQQSTGNVGVGTTNPTAKLEVSGDLKLGSGTAVNGFSTSTTLGSSNSLAPTQNAVKTYVDNTVGSITESDPTWNGTANTTGSIGRTGDVGIGTESPAALLHASGTGTGEGNVLFVGEFKSSDPGPAPIEGPGTRIMWYPDKAAFRVGRVQSNNWNSDQIGAYSLAWGNNTRASNDYSTAWGNHARAYGSSATAWGWDSEASGSGSTAWGFWTKSIGNGSTAWGYETEAAGVNSTAWGELSESSGNLSTAWGFWTKAIGYLSTSWGYFTQSSGSYSTAWGSFTQSSGMNSTAWGAGAQSYSYAETAVGGYNTTYTPASINSWNSNDRLFVIGNGMNSLNPSDAMVVLKNGNTGIGISTPNERLEVDGNIHVSGGNRTIFNRSNNFLAFGTNNQERMRITNGGNIGIGTDSPGARLHVERTSSSSTPQIRIHNASSSGYARLRFANESHEPYWDIAAGGSNNQLDFWQSGGTGSMLTLRGDSPNIGVGIRTTNPSFTLHVNGDAGKPGGGSWSSTSDSRLKHNIQDLQSSLDALLNLRGVSFMYNDPEGFNELPGERIGMIAQEVAEVFPDWVNEAADGYLRLTYRGFEALMVEALRELREEKDAEISKLIENQDAEVSVLKAENNRLHAEKDAQIKKLHVELSNLTTSKTELSSRLQILETSLAKLLQQQDMLYSQKESSNN